VVVPLRYRSGSAALSFFSMTAVVGTHLDVTVEELAIESFYPADPQTAAALTARRPDRAESPAPDRLLFPASGRASTMNA
jgi:hypothetical protein